MHYGDRPEAAVLWVVEVKMVDLGMVVDEETAKILKKGYIDDGVGGGSEETVANLVGQEVFNDEIKKPTHTDTAADIMGLGGFIFKYMLRNREKCVKLLNLYGGSVLVSPWNTV